MKNKAPGGAESNASGEGQNQTDNEENNANSEQSADAVNESEGEVKDPKAILAKSRELLNEVKNLRKTVKEVQTERDSLKTTLAKGQNDYKTLWEDAEKRAKAAESKSEKILTQTQSALKMSSVLDALPGKVDKKYFDILQPMLEEIDMVGEDEVDENAVRQVADRFAKLYPEVVVRPGTKMPNEMAKGGGENLDLKSWQTLGDAKKMREKLPELWAAHKAGKIKI
jgi:chromosome segregation ATPase